MLKGEVEMDETFVGGKRKNMRVSERKKLADRGPVGKTAVIGAKQRGGKVTAAPIRNTDDGTLTAFGEHTLLPGSTVYTDEYPG